MTDSSSTSEPPRPAGWRRLAARLRAPGRAVGLGALVLALAVVAAGQIRPLRGARLAGFDALERAWPRVPQGTPAVIVAIDEASLQRFG